MLNLRQIFQLSARLIKPPQDLLLVHPHLHNSYRDDYCHKAWKGSGNSWIILELDQLCHQIYLLEFLLSLKAEGELQTSAALGVNAGVPQGCGFS